MAVPSRSGDGKTRSPEGETSSSDGASMTGSVISSAVNCVFVCSARRSSHAGAAATTSAMVSSSSAGACATAEGALPCPMTVPAACWVDWCPTDAGVRSVVKPSCSVALELWSGSAAGCWRTGLWGYRMPLSSFSYSGICSTKIYFLGKAIVMCLSDHDIAMVC